MAEGVKFYAREDPRYNDNVCYQRFFCCQIKFAVKKKLDRDPSKAWVTDTSVQFFLQIIHFVYLFCIFVRIPSVS